MQTISKLKVKKALEKIFQFVLVTVGINILLGLFVLSQVWVSHKENEPQRLALLELRENIEIGDSYENVLKKILGSKKLQAYSKNLEFWALGSINSLRVLFFTNVETSHIFSQRKGESNGYWNF